LLDNSDPLSLFDKEGLKFFDLPQIRFDLRLFKLKEEVHEHLHPQSDTVSQGTSYESTQNYDADANDCHCLRILDLGLDGCLKPVVGSSKLPCIVVDVLVCVVQNEVKLLVYHGSCGRLRIVGKD
jgi:hypothetical protein